MGITSKYLKICTCLIWLGIYAEARGFLFSYEKLFGAKDLTKTDINNQQEGKETNIERTRRLFYLTCSRTEESLAIVAYTKAGLKLKQNAISQEWFDANEIIDTL